MYVSALFLPPSCSLTGVLAELLLAIFHSSTYSVPASPRMYIQLTASVFQCFQIQRRTNPRVSVRIEDKQS